MHPFPLVSIIIPVYNCEIYIDSCIQSVIKQSYKNIEIIIINDGSVDASPSIIMKYAKADSRIIYIDKTNKGLVLARKSGLDIAKGKYIQHLDGDDSLFTDAIEHLVNKAEYTNADIIAARFMFRYKDKKSKISTHLRFNELTGIEYYQEILTGHAYWSVWSNFHKRSLYEGIPICIVPQISYGEDAILMTQLILKATKIVAMHRPILNYNIHDSSITGSMDNRKHQQFRFTNSWVEKYINEKGLATEFQYALAHWHTQTTIYSIRWHKFRNISYDILRMSTNIKRFPELGSMLTRKEKKIVRSFGISSILGYLKIYYYIIRKKI